MFPCPSCSGMSPVRTFLRSRNWDYMVVLLCMLVTPRCPRTIGGLYDSREPRNLIGKRWYCLMPSSSVLPRSLRGHKFWCGEGGSKVHFFGCQFRWLSTLYCGRKERWIGLWDHGSRLGPIGPCEQRRRFPQQPVLRYRNWPGFYPARAVISAI